MEFGAGYTGFLGIPVSDEDGALSFVCLAMFRYLSGAFRTRLSLFYAQAHPICAPYMSVFSRNKFSVTKPTGASQEHSDNIFHSRPSKVDFISCTGIIPGCIQVPHEGLSFCVETCDNFERQSSMVHASSSRQTVVTAKTACVSVCNQRADLPANPEARHSSPQDESCERYSQPFLSPSAVTPFRALSRTHQRRAAHG